MTFRLAKCEYASYSYTMNSGGLNVGSLKYRVHNDGMMVALTPQSLDHSNLFGSFDGLGAADIR